MSEFDHIDFDAVIDSTPTTPFLTDHIKDCMKAAIRADREGRRIKLEIRKYDGMHAFGGYAAGSAKGGKAIILIDGEMLFKEGELLHDGKPYDPPNSERKMILIETLMHEFGHALEELFERETDEDFIEKCVESYRNQKTEG